MPTMVIFERRMKMSEKMNYNNESNPELRLNSEDKLKSFSMPRLQAFGKSIWIVEGPKVRDMVSCLLPA